MAGNDTLKPECAGFIVAQHDTTKVVHNSSIQLNKLQQAQELEQRNVSVGNQLLYTS